MTSRLGELRPLLACRDALAGLRTGSVALAVRGINWCGRADDPPAARGRFYTLVGGVVVAGYAAVRYPVPAGTLEAVGWCVAAWMHAPAPEPEEEPLEQAGEQPAPPPADPLPGLLWDLIGDAPGVHLKTVVEHLHETGLDTDCDRAAVRAALTRRGIAFKGSVREADNRVNEGVHRDDLQAWEEARSPTPPAVLSKTRSDPVATALTCDVANPATPIATPPTPHEAAS